MARGGGENASSPRTPRTRREDTDDDDRIARHRSRSPDSRSSRAKSRSRERERSKKKEKKSKKSKTRSKEKDTKAKKDKKRRTKDDTKTSRRDGERRRRRRERRRHKESDSESDSSASASSGSSGSDESEGAGKGPRVDLKRAATVVRELLVEFPAIAPDLLSLLQMLDDGGTAVISGIENARVKSLLATLFPLLGIKKLRKHDGAYVSRGEKRETKASGSSLLETVANMLSGATESASSSQQAEQEAALPVVAAAATAVATATAPLLRRDTPIGPMRPPQSSLAHHKDNEEDDDDDDDLVGPALPGMKGFREADEQVEAEMARRAKEMKEDEWRRARGEPPRAVAAAPEGGRQAWMTQMPEDNKTLADAMGGAAAMMKPASGRPAAFRSKEPATIDRTWFDSPEERERAKRAKLDIELLGYVRPENAAPARQSADPTARTTSSSNVNESILPAANPDADQDMRRQMDILKQKRGPSLLEQHQQKLAAQQQTKKDANQGAEQRSTWNRDRDLTARRGLTQDAADRVLSSVKEISSKFTAPTVTRQFL